jgi:hypothetical protein
LCLWSKRLEGRDRFLFPREVTSEMVQISGAQLDDLLAGFDLWRHICRPISHHVNAVETIHCQRCQ